jgi:hypothetical protein
MFTPLRNPTEEFLTLYEMLTRHHHHLSEANADSRKVIRESLQDLKQLLNKAGDKRPDYGETLFTFPFASSTEIKEIAPEDLEIAQELYCQVVQRGGNKISSLERNLLRLIATTFEPSTVPFWVNVLKLTRSSDKFRKQRKKIAVASLMLLVLVTRDKAAYDALVEISHGKDTIARNEALQCLSIIARETEYTLPEDFEQQLFRIATTARGFEARFYARQNLFANNMHIPLDNPGGVYVLRVSFWDDTEDDTEPAMYRTIAIRSEQTLEDLHDEIQVALGWDDDHLYSFYLNGKKDRDVYEFYGDTSSHLLMYDQMLEMLQNGNQLFVNGDDEEYLADGDTIVNEETETKETEDMAAAEVQANNHKDTETEKAEDMATAEVQANNHKDTHENGHEDEDDDADEDDGEWDWFCASNALIGELGLVKNHTFLYLFDFGDDHEFAVTVLDILPHTEGDPDDYPRLIDSKGEDPQQYWYADYLEEEWGKEDEWVEDEWDDDEWDDDEWDDDNGPGKNGS